ncbi:helix-turn-helix domain-containing protein [Limosilactobacillus reuteri]|uniref:helix-turn-helix domain-containing protein n=1 Tax=Limosilactobacillus reuteri TaxID=1598 RepID=UPI003F682FBC
MEQHPSYYTNIPAFVRYDEELLRKSKSILLYGEIVALSNQKGYCWASNSYFAERLRVSGRMIQDYLDILVTKGYVARKLIYKPHSKQVDKRILSIASRPGEADFMRGDEMDFTRPGEADFAENITSINNTSTNKLLADAQHSFQEITTLWQNNWGFPNGIAQQDLTEWSKEFGNDLIYYCVEFALRHNVTARGADPYLNRKLSDYRKQGIKTVQAAIESDQRHEQQMSREYQQKSGSRKRQPINEPMPECFKKQQEQEEQSNKRHYERIDDSGDPMPHD